MSSIFPLRETVTPREREPRLVDLDEETADEVFDALSSQTTRRIFLTLHQSPQTASDLADATDTSVQNVQYHLGKLDDADLVEVVDTWYSERGTEMKVYAPKDDSLVLFAGRDKQSTLRSLLNRVAGIFTVLVPISILAGLSAHWTAGTDEGDPETVVDLGGSDRTGDVSSEGGDGTDGEPTGGDLGPASEPDLQEPTTVDGAVVTENDTAYIFDNETVWAVENATMSDTQGGNESTFVIEGDVGEATNETVVLVRGDQVDAGSNITLPPELVDSTVDTSATIAGLDPALVVGASVLLGGLLVAGALAAWYGVPGWSGATSDD